jgi:hypothetical protein
MLAREGEWDEYGFHQCEFCGGAVQQSGAAEVGFRLDKDKRPVILSRCANPHTIECEFTIQTRSCADEPLPFGVIQRDEELYYQLRAESLPGERGNAHHRRKFGNEGKNPDTRVKALGIAIQRLRAAVAHFLDLFRLCLRMGWIGNHPKRYGYTPVSVRRAEAKKRKQREKRQRARAILAGGPSP